VNADRCVPLTVGQWSIFTVQWSTLTGQRSTTAGQRCQPAVIVHWSTVPSAGHWSKFNIHYSLFPVSGHWLLLYSITGNIKRMTYPPHYYSHCPTQHIYNNVFFAKKLRTSHKCTYCKCIFHLYLYNVCMAVNDRNR
jgi:hypothetical protein